MINSDGVDIDNNNDGDNIVMIIIMMKIVTNETESILV